MEFNGFQRNDESVAEDETAPEQPRSSREMPGGSPEEAPAPAARTERTSGSTARPGPDPVKKTRPRRCRGPRVFPGERTVARSPV